MESRILRGPITKHMAKMGVGEYFWQAAENYGERTCQIDAYTHKRESFDTVRKRAIRVAIQLKKLGVQRRDTVMVCCLNNLDNVVPSVATLFLGACACPIDQLFITLFGVKYFLTQVNPKVIFVNEMNLKTIEKEIKFMTYKPQICVIGKSQEYTQMYDMEKIKTKEEINFKPAKVDVQETAFIVFSSGTTSLPKGICLSHLGAMFPVCHYNGQPTLLLDDPIVQFFPLYWISSIWIFTFSIVSGQPIIVGQNISAKKFLQLVDTYKVLHGMLYWGILYDLVNMEVDILNSYNLSSLKVLSMGGSFIDPQLILRLRKMFPWVRIVQSYGSTEISIPPTYWAENDEDTYENKISSIGRPSWNVEIKVVDVETRETLGANQKGELLIKSPFRMNGYCNKDFSEVFDREGFLKTGDLAYYDEDDYVYIIDRLNDIFKYRGFKIAPIMIEAVLMKHPAIKEAVVFGIPHSAHRNYPAAYIALKENSIVTAEDIYRFVETNMSDIYLLRGGIKFLKELPRTTNGKLSRNAAKTLFLSSD